MILLLIAFALGLAFWNGANDNAKGVATLIGSRVTGERRAIAWATAATLLGCLAAAWLAGGIAEAFRGRSLVPDELCANPRFLSAVAVGAAGAILLATLRGLPVSTTHALLGGLIGAGVLAGPVRISALRDTFLLPLAASPLLALLATVLLYPFLRRARQAFGVDAETCLCVGEEVRVLATEPLAPALTEAAVAEARLSAAVDTPVHCIQRYRGRVVGIDAQTALAGCHFLSAGALSFARGLNDAPKIAALLLLWPGMDLGGAAFLVGAAMAAGGLLQAGRIADTMGHRVADMNAGQGFTTNMVSALLVIGASRLGLPVSTTHVTCGALFGIGLANGTARRDTVRKILLAWLATLPAAALLAAGALLLFRWV